ncbi:DUF2812 domain-containing protein [Proteiniclasticum sp. SCR006]|uniref:DUF2812 domain-containing protein n=1 Tax=Proteiniclasticum aestuarii TaxID=2817862 RepID=A0A939HAY7_9CLOT|nr:DUF2812 domain-containing protein [Proteiniclasticum aestuarii]MBO1264622.1 DUF2812 domain-containing protein [Proteiniclasticum aestuarii]
MKMKRKMIPVDVYDIPAMQSYLGDMAAEGLFLRKVGTYGHFEEGEPRRVLYRMEPLMRDEKMPREDQMEAYKDYGWDYVCTIANGFHIYSTEEKDYRELHTDPVTQSYAFSHLEKKLKLSSRVYLLSLPIMVVLILLPVFQMDQPLLFAVRYGNSSYQVMLLILYAFLFHQIHASRKKLKLLLDGLEKGEELPRKRTYRKNYGPYVINGILGLFGVIMIINSVLMMTRGWEKNLAEITEPIPMIQLTDIEQTEGFVKDQDGYRNEEIRYDWTELAPVIYELHQSGEVKGEMWADGSGTYSPYLSSEYYEVRFAFLGNPLVKELMEDALEFHRYRPIQHQELFIDGFDDAILVKSEDTQMFFGRIGRSVLYVRYHGYEDLSAHLDEIYDTLRNYQKEKM